MFDPMNDILQVIIFIKFSCYIKGQPRITRLPSYIKKKRAFIFKNFYTLYCN